MPSAMFLVPWVECAGRPQAIRRVPVGADLRGLRGELLRLLDCILDGADHVEGRFRQVVVLALDQPLEAANRVLERYEHAWRTGKHFGHEERLAHEALDLAGA